MACGIFLNFEKLSTQIIENEIALMDDDNLLFYDDGSTEEIKEENFLKNLYHGAIVTTFIVNLYETTLNTILSRRLECTEIDILKTSHSVKLQLICTMFHTDLATLKGDASYPKLQSIIKLRNDITHFKSNEIAEGHFIPASATIPMGTSKESLAALFTRTKMQESYKSVLTFLGILCQNCGLVLNTQCEIIDCDGRDELCEFVVTQEVFDRSERYD